MRIPGKNAFGNSIVGPAPVADTSAVQRANINLGNTLQNVGGAIQDQQLQQMKLTADRNQQLAQAKDASAFLDHQLQVKELEQSYTEKLARGEIKTEDAQSAFDNDLQSIPPPKPTAQGRLAALTLSDGVRRVQESAKLNMGARVQAAQDQELRSQGVSQLDILGKQGSLPGADVEQINQQADSVLPLLRKGGMNETDATRTIQNFKDANWFNQASQKAMTSRESVPALQQLEHDLTAEDGFYVGKMDTDKRNQVLNQVIGHRIQLENRFRADGDKRDNQAARALNQIDAQIASGVPATPEMWSDWTTTIKGTQYEGEFKDRVNDEREVQSVLRLPAAQQLSFIQQKTATLNTEGGSVRDKANLTRLAGTVNQNIKSLTETPLLYAEARTGKESPTLDITTLATDPQQAAGVFADRLSTLTALRKENGNQVPLALLKPQEADAAKAALLKATPEDKEHVFAALHDAVGDPKAFNQVVQQITADPVDRLAAISEGYNYKTSEGRKVSQLLMEGQGLLKDKSTQMPPAKAFDAQFAAQIGDAVPRGTLASETALQGVKAVYAALAKSEGANGKASEAVMPDASRLKRAIDMVTGGVTDYNGSKVIPPYGMGSDAFLDAVKDRITRIAPNSSHSAAELAQYPLERTADGFYVFKNGRSYLPAKDGSALKIHITP